LHWTCVVFVKESMVNQHNRLELSRLVKRKSYLSSVCYNFIWRSRGAQFISKNGIICEVLHRIDEMNEKSLHRFDCSRTESRISLDHFMLNGISNSIIHPADCVTKLSRMNHKIWQNIMNEPAFSIELGIN